MSSKKNTRTSVDNISFEDSSSDVVQREVDKKIALLIAEEELRKQREKERSLRLEKIKNESFQKKLEQIRTELEFQEFKKQVKLREMKLLEVESAKMDAEERMLEEIKQSTLETLQEQSDVTSLDSLNFEDESDALLEARKAQLLETLKYKKDRIKQKENELTRIISLADLNK